MKKFLSMISCLIFIYCSVYVINSSFGGYNQRPELDGRNKYNMGLSMCDAIKWKPVYGDWLVNDGDVWGYVFYPLLMLDREYWHETHYITDEDFFEWARNVPKDKWKKL